MASENTDMELFIDKLGGRKVIMALLVLTVGIGAMIHRGDIPTNMLSLIQMLFAAFIFGNGVEHMATASVYKAEAKAKVVAPVKALDTWGDSDVLRTVNTQLAVVIGEVKQLNQEIAELKTATAATQTAVSAAQQGISFIITKGRLAELP